MWQVIKRNSRTGSETRSKAMSWDDAHKYYEKAARSINAVDEDGHYKLPYVRISLGNAI